MRLIFCRKTSFPDEALSSEVYNNKKKVTAKKATAKNELFQKIKTKL
jgi:hypothetical protein